MALCGSQNCGCAIQSSSLSVSGSGTALSPWTIELTSVGGARIPLYFVTDTARDAALPSPATGALAYIDDDDIYTVWTGSEWVPLGGNAIAFASAILTSGLAVGLGSTGSGTGWYSRIGDLVYFQFVYTFGGTGITAGTGTYSIPLPVTAKTITGATVIPRGWVEINDGGTYREYLPHIVSNSALELRIISTGSFSAKTSLTAPGDFPGWAAGDQITGWVIYQAA